MILCKGHASTLLGKRQTVLSRRERITLAPAVFTIKGNGDERGNGDTCS